MQTITIHHDTKHNTITVENNPQTVDEFVVLCNCLFTALLVTIDRIEDVEKRIVIRNKFKKKF
jgi:hypothetical protein